MTAASTNPPARRSTRKTWAAVAIVALISIGCWLIFVLSQRSNARLVTGLSARFMEELASKVRSQTLGYLDAGSSSVATIAGLVRRGDLDWLDDEALDRHLLALLIENDQIAMLNVGRPSGDFSMVKRMPDGSFSFKKITRQAGLARSSWVHEEASWATRSEYGNRQEDAAQAYDPRARPWYRRAESTGSLIWSEPYFFYSDQKPGIACSLPISDRAGGFLGVLGADIGIENLSTLLASVRIGVNGQAMILTADGGIIAASGPIGQSLQSGSAPLDDPQVALPRVLDSPESLMATAFRHLAPQTSDSFKAFTFVHRQAEYVARFEPLQVGVDPNWLIGVVAPQSEFSGALLREERLFLAITTGCFLAAILLAVLVVRRAAAREDLLLEQRDEERRLFIEGLEAKNREIEVFAYSVSHDLKSPLNTLGGFAGLLRRRVESGDKEGTELALSRIEAATERMSNLVDALLLLGRVGEPIDQREPVDLGEVTRETLESLEASIAESGVEVAWAGELPTVMGERVRLRQAIQNLVENAIKYMGDQSHPRIEIGPHREGGLAGFFVRDNGSGIEARHLDQIFETFRRFDTESRGSGLGLATVKRIVEVLGGRIWAESPGPDQGSTFYVLIPIT